MTKHIKLKGRRIFNKNKNLHLGLGFNYKKIMHFCSRVIPIIRHIFTNK
jgi:hypothetical protein